jgi:hypothetical protein
MLKLDGGKDKPTEILARLQGHTWGVKNFPFSYKINP